MAKRSSGQSTMTYLDHLHKVAPKDVVKLNTSMQYGEETKYVTVDMSTKTFPDGIELMHLTDVQFGHEQCNVEQFEAYCDWILKEPNRFVLFGGDMIDAATMLSIASPYENTEEPQGQIYRFCEIANRMRHRVLGYVGGNHERRTHK